MFERQLCVGNGHLSVDLLPGCGARQDLRGLVAHTLTSMAWVAERNSHKATLLGCPWQTATRIEDAAVLVIRGADFHGLGGGVIDRLPHVRIVGVVSNEHDRAAIRVGEVDLALRTTFRFALRKRGALRLLLAVQIGGCAESTRLAVGGDCAPARDPTDLALRRRCGLSLTVRVRATGTRTIRNPAWRTGHLGVCGDTDTDQASD